MLQVTAEQTRIHKTYSDVASNGYQLLCNQHDAVARQRQTVEIEIRVCKACLKYPAGNRL